MTNCGEVKLVKIDKCSNSDWWYDRCEGMTIYVYRKPFISPYGRIVYLAEGTQDRRILVEDVIDTKRP